MEIAIPRLNANLVFRVLIGGAQLGALYLATHAVGTAVGWKVMADAEPPAAAEPEDEEDEEDDDPRKTAKDKTKKNLEYAQRVPNSREERLTKYNIFCPSCAPAPEEAPGLTDEAVLLADMEFPDAVRTSLPLTLVATMEAEDPGISLATITRSDGGTGVFAEGEDVLDNVTLLSVNLGLVYLRTAARVEYLPLSSGEPPPPPKAPDKDEGKDEKPKKKSKYAIDGAEDAIKCTKNSNGNSCTVERQFVTKLMSNPAMLATQARPRPYDKYGVQGYQLSRIRKGSLPYMLGIRSGNVIKAINGHELKSMDGAMKLYTQLRTASHLSVDYVQGKKGKLYEKRLEIDII